jgi:hypothetical protein
MYLVHPQIRALFAITPEDIAQLSTEQRLEYAFQHLEQQVRRREAFWNAVQAFAAGALPIFAFLGYSRLRR